MTTNTTTVPNLVKSGQLDPSRVVQQLRAIQRLMDDAADARRIHPDTRRILRGRADAIGLAIGLIEAHYPPNRRNDQ